ncbi:MAG: acylphosphatase [Spirochaetales bacterium]|nr:acylphosphatase [Spirochaetales bacterium]
MNTAVRVRVYGRVQGVGFRYYTVRQGRSRGLAGWVRNESDGTVLVHLQGPRDIVDEMCLWLEKGPSSARVERTQLTPSSIDPNLFDFDIDY